MLPDEKRFAVAFLCENVSEAVPCDKVLCWVKKTSQSEITSLDQESPSEVVVIGTIEEIE